jgi:hypothetical protein
MKFTVWVTFFLKQRNKKIIKEAIYRNSSYNFTWSIWNDPGVSPCGHQWFVANKPLDKTIPD